MPRLAQSESEDSKSKACMVGGEQSLGPAVRSSIGIVCFQYPSVPYNSSQGETIRANKLFAAPWVVALDIPLHREDRELELEQLNAKRLRWLSQHDQHTSHITSQLPLVQGMPVRLTENVDRDLGLVKSRRGWVTGWVPEEQEEKIDVDGDWLLTRMPRLIYVHFPDATWELSEDLPCGTYPLKPSSHGPG